MGIVLLGAAPSQVFAAIERCDECEARAEPPASKAGGGSPLITVIEPASMMKAPSMRNIDTSGTQPLPTNTRSAVAVGGVLRPDTQGRSGNNTGGMRMKCWQNGRLLIDKAVQIIPTEAESSRRLIDAETGFEIITFDLKNAMCMIE